MPLFNRLLALVFLLNSIPIASSQDMIGYYSFCNCNANDNSGNNNHGNLIGFPKCIKGERGEGFLFNQTPATNDCNQPGGQYIKLPEFGAIWANGFTISAWIRFDNISNFERIIDIGNEAGELNGMPVWFGREGNSNNLTLESWINNDPVLNRTTGRLVAQDVIINGANGFYCATIANDSMKIYVNGSLVAAKKGNGILNVPRTRNYIGRSNWCQSDPDFKGFMDEVRLYNRALSADEIKALYEASPSFLPFSTPVCPGQSVQLLAQGGTQYEWSPPADFSNPSVPNPVCTPDKTSTYNCKITLADGCTYVDSLTIQVFDPTPVTTVALGVCNQQQVKDSLFTFIAVNGCDSIVQYIKYFDYSLAIIQHDTTYTCSISPPAPDSMFVDGINACDTLKIRYAVFDNAQTPVVLIEEGSQLTMVQGDSLRLHASPLFPASQIEQIQWTGPAMSCDSCLCPVIYPVRDTLYHLQILTKEGCLAEQSIQVRTIQIDYPVYIPNVFSPSANFPNNEIRMFADYRIKTIKDLKIFDRWGELVFERQNLAIDATDAAWDGMIGSKPATAGVYVMLVCYKLPDNSEKTTVANFVLLR